MSSRSESQPLCVELANHLGRRREPLLRAWRAAVTADKQIGAAATLARSQFIDHIPRVLDAFEAQLRARAETQAAQAAQEQRQGASDHGMQRWLHGYHYRETMREWGQLQLCLAAEVERFALSDTVPNGEAMAGARHLMMQFFVDCMVESAASQVQLEQTEAATRLRDLEKALEQSKILERERAELWREAAHDLRGNVGAVRVAAGVLAKRISPDPRAVTVVERTTGALTALLDDLVALARLESGHEQRCIALFDAGQLIQNVCEELQPMASARDLMLRSEVTPLHVDGDAVKVRRIAQNLILNALKFTERGGVQITVNALQMGAIACWQLCVQDTGVGIDERASPAIAKLLSSATRAAELLDARDASPALPPISVLRSESTVSPRNRSGEGVGLAIVKRLCELLDATIQVETAVGRGTTFRLVFPVRYPESDPA